MPSPPRPGGLLHEGGRENAVTATQADVAPGAGTWLGAHPAVATLFIAVTASIFALGSTLIRFAYDAGAGTLTIVMVRTTIAASCLAILLAARGVKMRFDRRERWAAP